LSANSYFASTDNITEPIESGVVVEPIHIAQSAREKETPVQLEVELTNEAGGATVQTRVVPTDQVAQAQRIIASTEGAEEAEQNRAIEEAIHHAKVSAMLCGSSSTSGRTLYLSQRPRLERV
jgi:hypothetical protein